MDIKDYKYNESKEDAEIRHFVEDLWPANIDASRIRAKTFRKIHKIEKFHCIVRYVSIAVSIAACLLALFIIYPKRANTFTTKQPLEKESQRVIKDMDTLRVPVGEQRTVTLPDGTRLTANSRSMVSYPKKFRGNNRVIHAEGEIYMEVTHDPCHPFIVNMKNFNIKVLGTKFNIYNYNGSQASVVLIQGSVELATSKNHMRMKTSEKIDVLYGRIKDKTVVNVSDYTSWRDGLISLNGDNITQVSKKLSDYYGIPIRCLGNMSRMELYGKLVFQKNLETVLASISKISGIKYYRYGKGYVISLRKYKN